MDKSYREIEILGETYLMNAIKERLKSNRVFIIIFLFASLLSLIHILPPFSADIINYDSAYQYCLTVQSPSEIARLIPEDYSPPLYTILLKLWTLVFGTSLAAMRSMSLLVIVGMLFLAAFPVRKAFGDKVSVLCTVFFFFTSINYKLIPEIRPTFFAYFFVTAAGVYCCLAFFKDIKYSYICFTVFSVCAMYTHNLGLLSAVAFYAIGLAAALLRKEFSKAKKIFASGIVSAVCYIPWLSVVLGQFENVRKNYWSNADISLFRIYSKTFLFNFTDFGKDYISRFLEIAIILALLAFFVAAVLKSGIKNIKRFSDIDILNLKKHGEEYFNALFMAFIFIGPIILWILFSIFFHPIFTERYFYIYGGIAMLCFALLTVRLGKKIGVIVMSVIMAVNFGIASVNLKNELNDSDFLDMISKIEADHPDGDIAFLHSHEWTLGIMMYYFPEARHYVFEDTWCVLNTYDVFPSEVINIGGIENMEDHEDEFIIFSGYFPDTDYLLASVLEENTDAKISFEGSYKEPYTYQKTWGLLYVKS